MTCVKTSENPPSCTTPSPGYYDNGVGKPPFPRCDSECATCSGTADNCITCVDPKSTPPQCNTYRGCLHYVRVESSGKDNGDDHKVFFNGVD